MSTTGSIVPHNFTTLHSRTCHRFQAFNRNSSYLSTISIQKDGCRLLGNGGLRFLSVGQGVQSGIHKKMAVCSSVPPGAPLPSEPPSPHTCRKPWVVGMLLAMILPFFRNKWGPLSLLKSKVDTVVETAEHIAEVVEKVAEEVEKVADEVGDHLPDGGKLKGAFNFVENLAKETAKDAHEADEVIDKLEEVEKDVESLFDQVSESAKEDKDKK
ncbi:hypothetical protein L1049_025561 [Liquidambar formosana]|uniref:Uncharacterized protein n=1 Tax=Liquidambar formosana TaxID=63359 RepID=A0AAP0NBP0_LIQFO